MPRRWFRGNLHTHSSNSDGDSPPAVVAAWYRDAGYDFLALTDHDRLTDPSVMKEASGPMLLLPGEEITSGPVHVNGLGIREPIEPRYGADAAETIALDVAAIRAQGAVPVLNHPNFRWSVAVADLVEAGGLGLFEVYNASPECNDGGRPGHPSTEALWDLVLSAGRRIHGMATDDAHHYRRWGRAYANPGRAWVTVRAERCTVGDLLAALEAGEFYASTGIELAGLVASREEVAIELATLADLHYTTRFIGADGRLLDEVHGPTARYRPGRHDGYVRARVEDSDGSVAWIQPVHLA